MGQSVTARTPARGSVHARAPRLQTSAARVCLSAQEPRRTGPAATTTTTTNMMMMMAEEDCVGFQAQIASIIEILANSAVAEVCKLVDDGYAALRSQMEREREKSARENDALRAKLRDTDMKLRGYERKMRRRGRREEAPAARFGPSEGAC